MPWSTLLSLIFRYWTILLKSDTTNNALNRDIIIIIQKLLLKSSTLLTSSSTLPTLYDILETIHSVNKPDRATLASLLVKANGGSSTVYDDQHHQFIMTLISRKFGFWNFLDANNDNTDEQFQAIGIGIVNSMITGINKMLIDSTFTSTSSPSSAYQLFESIKINSSNGTSTNTNKTNSIFSVEKYLVDYFKDFWRKSFAVSPTSPPLKKLIMSFRKITSYIKIALIGDFNIKGNNLI